MPDHGWEYAISGATVGPMYVVLQFSAVDQNSEHGSRSPQLPARFAYSPRHARGRASVRTNCDREGTASGRQGHGATAYLTWPGHFLMAHCHPPQSPLRCRV